MSSCGSAPLKLSIFPLNSVLNALRGGEAQRYAPDVLGSYMQTPCNLAVLAMRPSGPVLSQRLRNQVKLGVQIETSEKQSEYKRSFITVKHKSVVIEQKRNAIGARVRALRKANGWNQTDLASRLGVSQVAISNWEKGYDTPAARFLVRLSEFTASEEAKKFFLEATEIKPLCADEEELPANNKRGPVRQVPFLKDAAAAGTPRAVDPKERLEVADLPRRWVSDPGEIYCLRIRGDSMYPIVRDGSWVVVNTSRNDARELEGHMVAAREGDGITIKWLRHNDGVYMLVPQHTSEDNLVRVMKSEGNFSIVGEVVGWFSTPPPPKK
jgi:repressor LexA